MTVRSDLVLPADVPALTAAQAAHLAAALRRNSTLKTLRFSQLGLCEDGSDVPVALIDALVGHPSLRYLIICFDAVPEDARAAVGAAVGRLVAANAPKFAELEGMDMDAVGLQPLIDALPHNTHLQYLDCRGNCAATQPIGAALAAAVRQNTSLTYFAAGEADHADLIAAAQFIEQRTDDADAAAEAAQA